MACCGAVEAQPLQPHVNLIALPVPTWKPMPPTNEGPPAWVAPPLPLSLEPAWTLPNPPVILNPPTWQIP
jgi:hypothetical protein